MNNENHGHFFNGFILGLIIGALAVFLFGTKSGKRIVKILSEEGLGGLQNIIDEYQEEGLEEEFDEEPPKVIEHVKESVNHKVKENEEDSVTNNHVEEVSQSPKKRFFKRIRR